MSVTLQSFGKMKVINWLTQLKERFFGKTYRMNVYADMDGNFYGGTIHDQDQIVIDNTTHILAPVFVTTIKIKSKELK